MKKESSYAREGYLKENYHYFHLRDTAGQERDFHFHDFDKIVLLLAGRVDYTVENMTYPLQPWDVLLVKHHTIHKAVIDRSEPYDRVIVYLDRRFFERSAPGVGLMDCFDWADQRGQYLLTPNEEQKAALGEALSSYEALIGDRQLGAQMLRDSCISRLLVHVNRLSVSASLPRGADTVSDPKIALALSYINENLSRDLSVEAICDRVFLSRYHFMRLFKAQTGMTVHAYVRQKRLIQAARRIREGMPAARAAAESGFSDYSAFHRAFREVFGTSPGRLKE
ncbi:MAG: helix-turn-helix domain-containing protein [Oscillospiraceae bacterium]|nr:helix-turn-helix domain-containing protein [Oscillospiraceae bacterium]